MNNLLQKTSLNDLTLKQRKWLKFYIETGSARQAALKAYECSEDSAGQIGYENLKKLDIGELMEDMGISDHRLMLKLDQGLEATKQLGARLIVKGNNQDLQNANAQTDDFIEVEDYAVRHKYLETALKLKKRLVNEDKSVNLIADKVLVVPSGGLQDKYAIEVSPDPGDSSK